MINLYICCDMSNILFFMNKIKPLVYMCDADSHSYGVFVEIFDTVKKYA